MRVSENALTRSRKRSLGLLALALACAAGPAIAADRDLTIEITGTPSIVFDSARNACAPEDIPDINPHAFRDAAGQVVMFALFDVNRPLRGPDFAHLKVDCHVALGSRNDADPTRYDDRNFITGLWTRDGEHVAALVHHEYHADDHNKCAVSNSLGCWYNTVLGYQSANGGLDFTRSPSPVIAAAPFRQDADQGHQRGFFNPSNVFSDGRAFYTLISTTGWDGQPYGNCLFRSSNPLDPKGWRAYDGRAFTIRYDDPYKAKRAARPRPCAIIGPFVYAVGTVVRHRPSGQWIALFQAAPGSAFLLEGFYYATSRDLFTWSDPKILLAGKTLYGDLCKAGPSIIGYPAMLDPQSSSRVFDEVGDHPDLFMTTMQVDKCQTGQRMLVREQLTIRSGPPS